MARDVARGLAHLHSRGLVHRDIALRNILVSAEGRAIIGDLGLCRFVDEHGYQDLADEKKRGVLLPVLLMAYSRNGRVPLTADVAMFGVAMAEAISGKQLHTPDALKQWFEE